MCHNPPDMASTFPPSNPRAVNQGSKPLNPNAQCFRPEKKTVPTTLGLSHPQTLQSLQPFPQVCPPVAAFKDGLNYSYPATFPYRQCGAAIYDAGSQPKPVYGVSDSEVEKVFKKFKGLEVYEASDCGTGVESLPRGRVQRPRFSSRNFAVNCRKKVWLPKTRRSGESEEKVESDTQSCGSGVGVLPFPLTVHEVMRCGSNSVVTKNIPNQLQWSKSWKKNGDYARIIPFPSTVAEVLRSDITTVMIKNIPNQFQRDDLLAILDKHCQEENAKAAAQSCKSAYDFVYLPMDFRKFWYLRKMANLGYAFVNFTNAIAAFRFFNSFHKLVWDVTENKKICEVTLAELQGKETLIKNFRNRLFWCGSSSFLPVVLEAPRDGSNSPRVATVGICVPRAPPKRIRNYF